MPYLMLVAMSIVAMVILYFSKEKEIMRIDWNQLGAFCAFLMMVFAIRIMKLQFLMEAGLVNPMQLVTQPPMRLWTFGLVFWEDMFFAVPIYFMRKYMKNQKIATAIIIMSCIIFGLGHLYQGWDAVALLSFAPYFITYHFGKKYGFGTTMCGHILYDFTTALVPILAPLLLGLR